MNLSRLLKGCAIGLLLFVPATTRAQGPGQGGANQRRPHLAFTVALPADAARLPALKNRAIQLVDSMAPLTQQMVDMLFSFGELGLQEEETMKYLGGILEKNGF